MATTQIRLPDETFYKLKGIAEIQARSLNGQIKFILEQYIKDYEKINGTIKMDNLAK